MIWLTLTLGAAGAVLGFLTFRVHVIVAGSVAVLGLCALAIPVAGLTLSASAGYAVAMVAALQVGYFCGIALLCSATGARPVAVDRTDTRRPMLSAD